MKLSLFALFAAGLALQCSSADAALVTFEDVPAGTTYALGDSFSSGGVQMTVVAPFGGSGAVRVTGSSPIGEGNVAAIRGDRALSFDVPEGTAFVDFVFANLGGVTRLLVNGDTAMIPTSGTIELGGTTVTGSNATSVPGGTSVEVSIVGAVSELTIGGQEFDFDNISLQPNPSSVPEPNSLLLLAATTVPFALRRRARAMH